MSDRNARQTKKLISGRLAKSQLMDSVQNSSSSIYLYRYGLRRSAGIGGYHVYDVLFCLAYGLWLSFQLMSKTFFIVETGTTIFTIARYISLSGMFLAYIVSKKQSGLEWLAIMLFCLLFFIDIRTNAPFLTDLIVLVFCGRFMNFRTLAKESLYISSIVLVGTIVAADLGIITNYISARTSNGRLREYLGFRYALYPAQVLFNITCIICYLKQDRLYISYVFVLVAANAYIFVRTDARLSFYISLLVIILAFSLRFRVGHVLGKIMRVIAPVSFVISFVASWYLTLGYKASNDFYIQMNQLLGGRLWLGQNALSQYGTTLFGQNVEFVGNGLNSKGVIADGVYNYVDALFIKLPIQYGWVFTIIVLFALSIVALVASRKRNNVLALIMIAFAAHCLIDDLAIDVQYNTFLFLAGICAVDIAGTYAEKWRIVQQDLQAQH